MIAMGMSHRERVASVKYKQISTVTLLRLQLILLQVPREQQDPYL